MNSYRVAQERAILRILLLTIATLLVLCLLAALTLGIVSLSRRSTLPEEQPDNRPSTDQSEQPLENENNDPQGNEQEDDTPELPDDTQTGAPAGVLLTETSDAGQAYIDQMIFVGESTTAHLRARGVLSGGKATKQVWADESGTMTLSLEILKKKIVYPETGESMTIAQAAALEKPAYMVLSFGTNGLSGFHSNPKLYAASYAKLIAAIKEASPETVIILQTVYPVGVNQTSFHQDAATLNGYINELNEQLLTIAKDNGVFVADTASTLKDAEGNLRIEYDNGDGLHLSATAYEAVLHILRTHAVQ